MELLNRKLVFKGHRVEVYEDELKVDDGRICHYDYVHNRNGAGMLLVDDSGEEDKLIFVKQFRNTLGKDDIEIPAGCQNFPEEDFLVCALREAEEETGLIPEKTYYLTKIIAAVGIFDEMTAIYIGTGLKKGRVQRDEDEYIDVITMTLDEAVEAIYGGRIIDSKTIIAILAYKDMKTGGRL
ncbi:MAG: NUDIX hydrolase [Eubacterium sp.]|nr:NUDIX hydrolase [Eubacterium sp.]MBR1675654.1 NUDIX hydrolase [Eubacterium sp.]